MRWGEGLRVLLACCIVPVAATDLATAQSFAPVQCSQCPTRTEVAWTYRLSGASTEMPQDPNCAGTPTNPCPHYINRIDHTRNVAGNSYIKQLGFRFDTFQTEPSYDKFSFGQDGGATTTLSGSPSLGWYDFSVSGSLQTTPARTFFDTDSTVTYPGVAIGRARVCCSAAPNTGSAYLKPMYRSSGVLLGTNDVVHFRTPVTCGGQHKMFSIWGTGGDFDLYVRCNAQPTPTSWSYRAISTDAQEYIHIPADACPCPGTWYATVHAFNGAGSFNIVTQSHYPPQHLAMRVGTDFNASSAQMSQFASTLGQSAKHFYGSTEGTVAIARIDLWNSNSCSNCGGSPCNLCFRNSAGTGIAIGCYTGGPIEIFQGYWADPEGVSHEFGHRYFCVVDEYYVSDGATNWQCGHSNMASPWGTQNNFCFEYTTALNHKRDKTPGATDIATGSVWQTANALGLAPWIPTETPDNYDYRSFDFNGEVGNVIVH